GPGRLTCPPGRRRTEKHAQQPSARRARWAVRSCNDARAIRSWASPESKWDLSQSSRRRVGHTTKPQCVRRDSPSPSRPLRSVRRAAILVSMSETIRVLDALAQGDAQAAAELLPLVYDELRRLAARQLAHEDPGQTLEPTALVHEAFLRLVGPADKRR